MKVYAPNGDVSVVVDLSSDGLAITSSSYDYWVIDETDAVIIPRTNSGAVVSGTTATVVVASQYNDIGAKSKALRTVVVSFGVSIGTVEVRQSYALANLALEVGVNSFQSVGEAMLTALDIVSIPDWDMANDLDKSKALRQAYVNLSKLTYIPKAYEMQFLAILNPGYLKDIVASINSPVPLTVSQSTINWLNMQNLRFNNLDSMNAVTLGQLPPHFYAALKRAQVVEADHLLRTPSAIETYREEGLISKTVGEASESYRNSKPLKTHVCRRTLEELGGYVTFSLRIGRS